jgi:hypothetical protein
MAYLDRENNGEEFGDRRQSGRRPGANTTAVQPRGQDASDCTLMANKLSITRNLIEATIAVLAGNAIYFLWLWPHLPAHARHEVYRIDLGLVIDFWLCATCFGLLKLISNFNKRR